MTTVSGQTPLRFRAAPDAFGAGALLSVDPLSLLVQAAAASRRVSPAATGTSLRGRIVLLVCAGWCGPASGRRGREEWGQAGLSYAVEPYQGPVTIRLMSPNSQNATTPSRDAAIAAPNSCSDSRRAR